MRVPKRVRQCLARNREDLIGDVCVKGGGDPCTFDLELNPILKLQFLADIFQRTDQLRFGQVLRP